MITSPLVLWPNEFLKEPNCFNATPKSVETWGHIFLTAWREFPGAVGIAAPQLGLAVNLFLWDSRRKTQSKSQRKNYGNPEFVLNPTIVEETGTETKTEYEGCLSCPGKVAEVPRRTMIVVQYTTEQNKQVTRLFQDWDARVFQHELDHLHGKLIVDHIEYK